MDAYTGFAYVYDEYMDNIPYEEWGQYMIALLKENGVSGDSSVLELGCGTGTVTRMLAKEGYDCVGLDMSEDMLSIASEKTFEEGSQVIYTCQDMRWIFRKRVRHCILSTETLRIMATNMILSISRCSRLMETEWIKFH